MKFITEAKQAILDRDDGKQADSADVAKLIISDLNQRVQLAMAWGYSRDEATKLVEGAFAWWQKYNREQLDGKKDGALQGGGKGKPTDETQAEASTEEHGGEPTSDPVEEGVGRNGPPPGVGR